MATGHLGSPEPASDQELALTSFQGTLLSPQHLSPEPLQLLETLIFFFFFLISFLKIYLLNVLC